MTPSNKDLSRLECDAFFDRCRTFVRIRDESQKAKLVSNFPRVKEGYLLFKKSREQHARTEAPDFNIFSLLRLEYEEVRFHSALIAHLLNPRGSHGQQSVFLEEFWKKVAPKSLLQLKNHFDFAKWRISTEKFTIKGNLDIVIESPADRILCVIENKVRASEGDDQLERYRDWLNIQRHYPRNRRLLFYLTPGGRISESLDDASSYTCLSYNSHLRKWLESAISRIRAPKVKMIIEQYLSIVVYLGDHL